jgi:DNA-binding LacI/PurR family transcriptional regulator
VQSLLERRIDGWLCTTLEFSQRIHELAPCYNVPAVVFARSWSSTRFSSVSTNEAASIQDGIAELALLHSEAHFY